MDEKQMLGIVERYIRKTGEEPEGVKITRISDWKTVYIEQISDQSDSRAIILTEYKVDGVTYRAGYSQRSQTVYISKTAG
jgi:hypothetical protein